MARPSLTQRELEIKLKQQQKDQSRRNQRIEEQVNKVKKTANSRVTKIFKMKEIVPGNKKVAQEAQAIKDPETDQLVGSNSEIKKVTLQYCLKTFSKQQTRERSCGTGRSQKRSA